MVVDEKTSRGVVSLIKVAPKAKANANYYISNILTPLLEKSVAKLDPGETHKVFIHDDAASSNTAKKTAQYARDLDQKTGMTIIPNPEIPVKSPGTSPMDFFGFGVLKQKLHLRKGSTFDGVRKTFEPSSRLLVPISPAFRKMWVSKFTCQLEDI